MAGRKQKRTRHDGSANLFEQQGHIKQPKPEATEFFRNKQTGPTQLCHFPMQLRGKSVLVVQERSHELGGAFLGQKLSG